MIEWLFSITHVTENISLLRFCSTCFVSAIVVFLVLQTHKHHKKHPSAETGGTEIGTKIVGTTTTHAPPTTTRLSTTTAQTTTTPPEPKGRRRKKKRVNILKQLHRRRKTRPKSRSAEQLQSVQELDTVIDEMQGLFDDKVRVKEPDQMLRDFTPLQSLAATMADGRPASSQEDKADYTWSPWGVWSSCSVTCGKGTEFRRRECLKRIGDTFEGEPVKHEHCLGQNKDKKYCSKGACPLSGESRGEGGGQIFGAIYANGQAGPTLGMAWAGCGWAGCRQMHLDLLSEPDLNWTFDVIIAPNASSVFYVVVPKGLLIFLGSLYKEGAKITSGTLVFCSERQTARKNISSFQKHSPQLRV